MKKIFTLLLICMFYPSFQIKTLAQGFMTSDTVIRKFYAATASGPDASWYLPGFDDSGWASDDSGAVGFGYGNVGYTIVSTTTKSLYERIKFQVADTSKITKINLMIDYDDGYVAYLNGIEVARVNVDTTKFPPYDAIANRSHRSELAIGTTYPVLGIYLDKSVLRNCLLNGDNVLAIHILNDNLSDNSLLCIPFLINLNASYYDYYELNSRYKRLIDIDSSNIPLVVISTDENYIPYEGTISAHMGIIDNGAGNYNKLADAFNNYDGLISLRIRGQSSRDFPKQSYRIELNDENGNDTSFALIGMPKESDWILFGPFTDKSQLRNKIVYDLGSKLGSYNPRSRFCELIINGQSVGLYMLTEKIKRDNNRVDIAKLEETEVSGVDVTGGYILKVDKYESNSVFISGNRQVEYPDPLQPAQKDYLNSFFHEYDSVIAFNNFRDPVIGFRKYLSDSSLVDFVIMNEITKNADAYRYSTYFYKDKEDKDNRVKFGPLWDYDLCFGNTMFQDGHLTAGWQYKISDCFKVNRLFQDTNLVDLFQARWAELRQSTLSNDSIFAYIDSLASYTERARIRNYEVWPVIEEVLFYPGYNVTTYDAEIDAMKNWLTTRLTWIDENIPEIYHPVKLVSPVIVNEIGVYGFDVFPNPYVDELRLSLYLEEPRNVKIEIINLTGQVIYMINDNIDAGNYEVNLTNQTTSSLKSGMYLVRLYLDNIPVGTQKIVKN